MRKFLMICFLSFTFFGCATKPIVKTGESFQTLDQAVAEAKKGNLEGALKNSYSALDSFKQAENEYGVARAKLLIGWLLQIKEDRENILPANSKSYAYFEDSSQSFSKLKQRGYSAYGYYSLTDLYIRSGDQIKGCDYYDLALSELTNSKQKDWEGFMYDQNVFSSPQNFLEQKLDYFCKKVRRLNPKT